MAFNAAAVKPQENGGVDSPQPTPAALTPPAAAAVPPSAPASSKEDQRHAYSCKCILATLLESCCRASALHAEAVQC